MVDYIISMFKIVLTGSTSLDCVLSHPVTPEVLNRISEQFRDSAVLKRDRDSLLTLVIHLICRSGNGAFNLLLFLLDTGCDDQGSTKVKEGSKVNKMVQDTCALVLVSDKKCAIHFCSLLV